MTMQTPSSTPDQTSAQQHGVAKFTRRLAGSQPDPATIPFDPGYDPATVEAHLAQSGHLMAMLKLSMASWLLGAESATRRKLAAAARAGVPVVTGGGPFEIAAARGMLAEYLDLCAGLGVDRVEAGEGFTELPLGPSEAVGLARDRGLDVQFELGRKHGGPMTALEIDGLVQQGREWLDAGARELVIEARESAAGVGLFADDGTLAAGLADRFAEAFGLSTVVFEAPDKASQFALLSHFGPNVLLANVRLEEVLRVETFRWGLHADSFDPSEGGGGSAQCEDGRDR